MAISLKYCLVEFILPVELTDSYQFVHRSKHHIPEYPLIQTLLEPDFQRPVRTNQENVVRIRIHETLSDNAPQYWSCGNDRRSQMSLDWEVIGYVVSSKYRVRALRRLSESPAPPSTIADDTECAVSHISRALQDLRDHGLVDLLVPEERKKGRIYGITDEGTEIWETIEAQNLA